MIKVFVRWSLGLAVVALLAWFLIPSLPPVAPAVALELEPALKPVLQAVAKVSAHKPARAASSETPEAHDLQPLTDESHEAFAAMSLQQLERIREIPGAAPLLDDILEYLKKDIQETVSLDNIPTDEHGLAVLDDEAIEHMIPDAALRAKWDKLMTMVAKHPEMPEE